MVTIIITSDLRNVNCNNKFTREACELYVKIPRPFMKAALMQIAEIAEKNGIMIIDKPAAERIAELRKKNK